VTLLSEGKKSSEKRLYEGIIWLHCDVHDLDYPSNKECPMCKKEK
jgi:hypothetical protein